MTPPKKSPRATLPAGLLATILAIGAAGTGRGQVQAADAGLRRITLSAARTEVTVRGLEAEGYDVLHGDATGPLELIVTEAEITSLRARGFNVVVLERGRPLREIIAERRAAGGLPSGYPDLDGVYAAMAQAEADHPSICRVVDLTARYGAPPTFEGRHLLAVRISDNVDVDEDEPAALVVSAHHCREIVTPVIALHAIAQLTDGYGMDPDITAAVDDNEIWIAPVWNPDGYVHVFEVENFWRKNRRVFSADVGVDTNRNYPFGWFTECAGSDDPGSQTYKGPGPGSESETQTMMTWSEDRHFAKVLDYHSSGRETLWGYACLTHPFDAYLQAEAAALSTTSGYKGAERRPSAEGEHYEWQLGARGAHAFLIETETTFQPVFERAESEAALVFPGILDVLGRPIPLSGHVTDAVSGLPVVAEVCVTDVVFENGEANASGGPFGRYHVFAPAGTYRVSFSAPGYLAQTHFLMIDGENRTVRDVRLTPLAFVGDVSRDGVVDFEDLLLLLTSWGACPAPPEACPGDFDGDGEIGFAEVLLTLANWS